VGDEDQVNGREVHNADAGAPLAAEDDEARREDGVDQDVFTGELDQEGRVPYESGTQVGECCRLDPLVLAGYWVGMTFTHEASELLKLLYGERPMLPEEPTRDCGSCVGHKSPKE
jgi:hypothetical protein